MAAKLKPPHRAEHLGSLLRPGYLLEARAKFDKEEIQTDQLRELEDKAILSVLQLQKDVGLKTLSDGEYRCYLAPRNPSWLRSCN